MSEKKPIRIVIVDDHEMVRRGLSLFLRGFSDLEVVGEAANGAEALQICEAQQPDVVLMDIVMPEVNGIEATRSLRERFPNMAIVALSSSGDTHSVTATMQAGATSYLLKNVSDDQFVPHDADSAPFRQKPRKRSLMLPRARRDRNSA